MSAVGSVYSVLMKLRRMLGKRWNMKNILMFMLTISFVADNRANIEWSHGHFIICTENDQMFLTVFS